MEEQALINHYLHQYVWARVMAFYSRVREFESWKYFRFFWQFSFNVGLH